MNTYLYENIVDSSIYFLGKYIEPLEPPDFRTKSADLNFLNNLECNYSIFLSFCANHKFFNTNSKELETCYTLKGCMSYKDGVWKERKDKEQPDSNVKNSIRIQNKLELHLQRTLIPSTQKYQTFSLLLRGGGSQKETYLLGVYYEDEEGSVVFYFFNYIKNVLLVPYGVHSKAHKEEKKICVNALIQLIEQKKSKDYRAKEDVVTAVSELHKNPNLNYKQINTHFKRHYNCTLFDKFLMQRLLYGLELLLFTNLRFKEISNKCLYSNYPDFRKYFTKMGLSPKKIRSLYNSRMK